MVWKRVGCCHVKQWPSVVTWEGWRQWRGEGCTAWVVTGQWSTTPRIPSPRHPSRHPARVHRQCWIIQCELQDFVLFLELFVLIGNRPIIGRLFGTDYRPTDNRPVRYRCIPTWKTSRWAWDEQLKGSWTNRTSRYISFFPPITQWCSISDVLFTGGRGVSDFSVLKYY